MLAFPPLGSQGTTRVKTEIEKVDTTTNYQGFLYR